jgi:TatD DNase family protein
MLIDTHCHLTYVGLAERQDAVVQHAVAAGVKRLITIGTHPVDHLPALRTAEKFPEVFAALGIHPQHAHEVEADFIAPLRDAITANRRVVAVGECGLDYHHESAPADIQKKAFLAQLALADQLHKPVILHVRDAHADALAILRDFRHLRFVVHCFSGTPQEARQWIELGAYIGFTGIITYKNAPDVRAACQLVPADRLLVETDAPYLCPQPVRKNKTNEPAFVTHVARQVAMERGITSEEAAGITTRNAHQLFGLDGFCQS